jgi:lactate permease
MTLNLLSWVLAFLPIIIVLVLMMGFHWGGSRAGAAGWFASILLGMLRFGAGPLLIAYSQAKAVLLTLDVLYIIWSALLLYHIADKAGAIRIISDALLSVTEDRTIQGLLLGWLFASFMQGTGGFGVPVAITAPLLVGVGFSPVQAVLMASIGHSWGVNFGSMASSFQTMLAVTGLPGDFLAPMAALFLGIACFACGMIVALIAGGWKGLTRSLPFILLMGAVMSVSQYLLVTNGMWTLGTTVSALAGLAAAIILLRFQSARGKKSALAAGSLPQAESTAQPPAPKTVNHKLLIAVSPYIVLVVLAFAVNLIPAVENFLSPPAITLQFPALSTSTGFSTPAEAGRSIHIFSHPGAVLTYANVVAWFIFRKTGYLQAGAHKSILAGVSAGAVKTSLGIIAMVGMATVMAHTGMTRLLAEGLSTSLGANLYPLAAPFIGGLGAFITGSNNNSNVLFGVLQMNTAQLLGLSVPVILGAQTAGGSIGSVFSPAKVLVGASTVGLAGQEGPVMSRILLYGTLVILLMSVVTLVLVWVG